jgi:CheY-like chemotaxis protein
MKKVLVVENQIDLRELLEATLESDEIEVVDAHEVTAKDVARSIRPDLIILDVSISTSAIKRDPDFRDIPILIFARQKDSEAVNTDDNFIELLRPRELINKVYETLTL